MGNKTLIYRQKVYNHLKESYRHLLRLESAFDEIEKELTFPLQAEDYNELTNSKILLAFCDQIIYRFSKLQDIMGAKLFKSFLLFQGENINKPFLDILNELEKIDIICVDEWFEMRDLRNEIAHDYGEDEAMSIEIINAIYKTKKELKKILENIEQYIKKIQKNEKS